MKILSNKKKKSQSQNQGTLKLNFIDQSMIMDKKNDLSSNYEKYESSRNKRNMGINTDNKMDESSSNDDNCDVKEIEKIISKSSNSLNPNKNINYRTNIKFLDKSENIKKNYIFLNNLYRMKNDDMNYNHFNENRTSNNSFMKDLSNKINLKRQGNINKSRNHHYNKSLKCFNNLMPYNNKKKIL